MIPARKSARFVRWFTRQVEKRIRADFSAVHIRGEETLRAALERGPVLVVANHTAWWDPMLAIYLAYRRIGADAFAMMDAKNLKRLPFLGRTGGFGFHLDDPTDRRRVLKYAADLLSESESNRLVWIFPEGAERPRALNVDVFRPGAAIIAKWVQGSRPVSVVPVGLRYEFRNAARPEAFISIGDPVPPQDDVTAAAEAQRSAVRAELACIDRFVMRESETDGFVRALHRSPSRLSAAAERMLSFFTRYPKEATP